MIEAAKRLIKQLSDPHRRSSAREQLISKGAVAVDELLAALEQDPPLSQKKDLMRILLEINDSRSADLFRKSLNSDDEEIRAISATGLFRLETPDALEACLATIDDSPDMLHYETTPSVAALSEMGIGVLSSTMPLLSAKNERTRQHAQTVLERVTFKEISRSHPSRPSSSKAKSIWKALWEKNGPYRWDAPEDQRQSAIKRWQKWLAEYAST
jgi:hypothetical protein